MKFLSIFRRKPEVIPPWKQRRLAYEADAPKRARREAERLRKHRIALEASMGRQREAIENCGEHQERQSDD